MVTLPLSEAQDRFLDVTEQAAAGEQITLTDHGVTRAMLVPVPVNGSSKPFLSAEGAMDILLHHQMDPGARDAIRCPGDTMGEDGLGGAEARSLSQSRINDLWIAASALALGVPVITQDVSFVRLAAVGGPPVISVQRRPTSAFQSAEVVASRRFCVLKCSSGALPVWS